MNTKNFEPEILEDMMTNTGQSLSQMSMDQPIMLVFLRHFGCSFCREALDELSKKKEKYEADGTKIVFVHMTENHFAKSFFDKYNIANPIHISDPSCKYYAAFGLTKASPKQLLGFSSFIRGFQATLVEGHGMGGPLGDGFQMPGVFLLFENEIKASFVHQVPSDRPDYEELRKCCVIA